MAETDSKYMPVLENVQVSLNEILEVRGRSLEEWELWGVLFQTTEAVQDIFLIGHACEDGVPQNLVTPDNLLCTAMGRVFLNPCNPENLKGTKYWCPEMMDKEFYSQSYNLEKIYVFTIGQTMLHAAYYLVEDRKQKKFSPLIKTVLQAMCQNDTDLRMVLSDISQVCTIHARKYMNGYSFSKPVILLHREVLGSLPEKEILSQVEQDVRLENEVDDVDCKSESGESDIGLPDIDYDIKNYSYGHRLGYHPELSASRKPRNSHRVSPKERWKKAYSGILGEIRKSKLSYSRREDILEEWKKYKAYQTICRVYEELTERRKMLELLRLSINIGPSAPVDVDRNPLLITGLKPKTIAELVLLLQRPTKKTIIKSPSDKLCSTPENSVASMSDNTSYDFDDDDDEIYGKPYYALDQIALNNDVRWSEIKSFPGPEFIIGRFKPHNELSLVNLENQGFRRSAFKVTVSLLNGEFIDIDCMPSSTVKQLYQAVADFLKLQERYLFGLSYEEDGEHIFIERKQRIIDLLNIFASSPTAVSSDLIPLSFRVKFYLNDVHLMRTQSLRHLYYLQLRKDFLDDDFCCDNRLAATLGSLALQAEFGDYDFIIHGKEYFLIEHYLSFLCIQQFGREEAKSKLCENHANLKGMSKELAELKFMQGMITTREYGCHFHKVLQNKRNTSSIVWLAIRPGGIEVYENVSGRRSKCQSYPWHYIKRISFSRKYFCVAPRSESHTGKHVVYRFYTSVLHRSQYLFTVSMAHHKFFLKLKSVSKASEIFVEDLDEEHSYSCDKTEMEKEIGCDLGDDDDEYQPKSSKMTRFINSVKRSSKFLNETSFIQAAGSQKTSKCSSIFSSFGSVKILQKRSFPKHVTRSSSAPTSVKKREEDYSDSSSASSKGSDDEDAIPEERETDADL